jgi:Domain of unknown function (DUF4410)
MRSGSFRTLQTRAVAIRSLSIFVLSVLSGCRATTENVVTYGGLLPRPQRIVVYNFTSSTIWSRGRITESMRETEGASLAEQQTKLQQDIMRLMTAQLVQEIGKLGLPVESAETAGPVTEGQLSIEGQFLTIDEGNRTRRLVIGFGAGAAMCASPCRCWKRSRVNIGWWKTFIQTPVVRGSLDSDPWQVWALPLVRLLQ